MYKIIDLFAGAGGLSLGFEMTKQFEVVAFVENNYNATMTYKKNHPGIKNYEDILDVDFKDIIREQGQIDVVLGGPPCQGFSNANRQRRKLINGSNELVKRYVTAIKELNPNIFVMENVKTIASDKHSYCLTTNDEKHIREELELNIYEKSVVLYEGDRINELTEIIKNNQYMQMVLLNETRLYTLLNIYKKKNKIDKYFEKPSNVKNANEIIDSLKQNENFPSWYNEIICEANEALQSLISNKKCTEVISKSIKKLWDIQKLFDGIIELNNKLAIYEILSNNHQIHVKMHTYVVIDFIKKSFQKLGYETNGSVFNAADFGVPQCRERYILIGVKKSKLNEKKIPLPTPLIDNPQKYVTVKDAIYDLEEYLPLTESMDLTITRNNLPSINDFYPELIYKNRGSIIINHVCTDTSNDALKRFKVIKQGGNFHSLPDEYKTTYEDPERTQNTIYKRLSYNKPSDTVVNVRKSMWIHPVLDRAISAREAARLQSFPDDYEFIGTKDSVYQQIGNAVPPLLGRAIAEVILDLLDCKCEYIKLSDIYRKYTKE